MTKVSLLCKKDLQSDAHLRHACSALLLPLALATRPHDSVADVGVELVFFAIQGVAEHRELAI